MESDRDLKEIIFELKFLHGNLLDTVNKIAVIAEVLGEEDADRILVTEVYVQDGENHWHPEEMSVWDWIGKLNDLVRWAEIKEQINRDS